MTIEDLPDPPTEGDSLTTRYQYFIPGSEDPVTYSISAAPMPSECDFSFFDPNDAACQEILFSPETSVSELFAILRQWVPQVQQNIDVIGNEIIKRGCNVNDRDGLTDMTLLHYTCKSGAHGIGDVETAAKFASQLIDLGADINLRSRWTNMNALHYAAYFDVPELITVILKNSKPKEADELDDVDATCSDFDFGTALHIAAFNLCTGAVKRLLEHGANPAFRNDKGQTPADVVPDPVDMPLEMADAAASAKEIKQMLLDAVPLSCDISKAMLPNFDNVTGKDMLGTLGLKLGDQVVIAGQKRQSRAGGQITPSSVSAPPATTGPSTDTGKQSSKPTTPVVCIGTESEGEVGDPPTLTPHSLLPTPPRATVSTAQHHLTSGSEGRRHCTDSESEGRCSVPPSELVGERSTDAWLTKFPELIFDRESGSYLLKVEPEYLGQLQSRPSSISRCRNRISMSPSPPRYRTSKRRHSPSPSPARSDSRPRDRPAQNQASSLVGTLRFCGTTEFASGQWAGIELNEPEGKNNGTVAKVQYFKCAPKHGIFAPLSKISKVSERKKSTRVSSSRPLPLVKPKKIDVTRITSKVNSGLSALKKESTSDSTFLGNERGMKTPPGKEAASLGSSSNSSSSTSLDSRRNCPKKWNSSSSNKNEVSKSHSIASRTVAGFWCGIELDKPHGKNDGSVAGVQYFSCPPRYGVFAPPSRVQRLTGSLDSLTDVSSSKMSHSLPGFRRSFSTTSASSQKEINRRNSFVKSKKSVLRRSWSNTTTTNTEGPVKLREGSQVLLTSSSEMGTIRYIGPTDFAPGIWLGLELRSAKGKNDGSVGDKRYFICKPNHGVLVRPSRVTYRGINGMKLVDDIC
ncbi:hypothetical protein JD844_025105 [Phrynosoma platyrhinos]|uniref:CAP-Gly domain-containing protein n=1 Tax=Phrynosoma platyrhinos TaxID=52577 RepID=A0ABQ7SZA3_PHRPL|nr:hypothetical protein JD844_025105 [Phrynosoma platyrhinos]